MNTGRELKLLGACALCGHHCLVNRLAGGLGRCRAGLKPKVASFCLHHGEEPMISGQRGSGTIFFSHCTLNCVYCQNYEISQLGKGEETDLRDLAEMMLSLQEKKAHNLNLVSPTPYAPVIIEALSLAREEGLTLPIVYNTGGYDSLDLLKELAGEIDIFLPDLKYLSAESAEKYSQAANYPAVVKKGIEEMFRQVGAIKLNKDGVAVSGLLIRHLVLPGGVEETQRVIDFIASLSKEIWVSLMAQYSPQYRAKEYKELARNLSEDEYRAVVEYAEQVGLHNLYVQELASREVYLPDFNKPEPFQKGWANNQ